MAQCKRRIRRSSPVVRAGVPIRFAKFAMIGTLIVTNVVASAIAWRVDGQAADQAERIQAGAVIEKEIGGREKQFFNFDLDAGMCISVVVEQISGDVRIGLLNSARSRIHEADRAGTVALTAIADSPSKYLIEIASLQRPGVSGRYRLKLENLRAAGNDDKQRLTAEQLLNEGLVAGRSKKQGDLKTALVRLGKAASIWEKLGDLREQAAALYFIALRHEDLGDYDEARKADEQALDLSRRSSDQIRESLVLGHLGNLSIRVEDDKAALGYFELAANAARAAGNPALEQIHLANSGIVAKRSQDYGRALQIYQQALKLARESSDESYEATILNNIARIYDLTGEKQKAIDTFSEILPVWRRLGNADGEGATLKNLGAVHESIGRNDRALEYYQQALATVLPLGNPNREAHIRADLARMNKALGKNDVARVEIEKSLAIFESLRARLANPTHRAAFAASSRRYTDLLLDLLMDGGGRQVSTLDIRKAFEHSELARARSLREMLRGAGVDFRQGAAAGLIERESALVSKIQALDNQRLSLLAANSKDERAAKIEGELHTLISQYESLQAEMRKSNPQLAGITQPELPGLDVLQQRLLNDGSLLLEYYLGDERSYLFAVTASSISAYPLPARENIEKVAGSLYDAMGAPGIRKRFETPRERTARLAAAEEDFNRSARELSRMLLDPVRNQIGTKTLLIVPDGVLQYVPFAALPDPRAGSPLVVSNEVINLPSAGALMAIRESGASTQESSSVAVIADPVFSKDDARFDEMASTRVLQGGETTAVETMQAIMTRGSTAGLDLPRLKYSRQEATAIASMPGIGPSLVALDFRASRETLASGDLSRFRYLHIATHGLINSEVPALSGLVLSLVDEDGKPRNGILKLNDIYNLRLDADLVVLSACQTALGREIRGEGVIGLTRGFMYAGARRVVSSLWMVDDSATAELMKSFYDGMLRSKLTPAAALRRAQIAMIKKDSRHAPYFWAGFILQGEPK